MGIKGYLKKAQKEKWAIGQFNISNTETLRAIGGAARDLKSPVIIGTSEGESRFLGLRQAAALVRSFREELDIPIFLNLDHGQSFDYIKEAIEAGYDAVHFDGSRLLLKENIEITRKVKEYADRKGILVEGEVGFIRGASQVLKEAPEIKKEDLTCPEEALRFVKETGVDSLAVSVGTFHGMEKGSGNSPLGLEKIALGRLKEIKEMTGEKVFLVLHGGSGTRRDDIKEAIKAGIVKININTELRVAFTDTLREILNENPEETTPYKYMGKAVTIIQAIVRDKIKLFGSRNRS